MVLFSVGQSVLSYYGSYLVIPGAAAALGTLVYFAFYIVGSYHCVGVLFFFPSSACFSHDELHFGPPAMKSCTSKAVGNHPFSSTGILFCPFLFLVTPSFERVNCLAQSWKFGPDETGIPFDKNNYAPESQAFNPYLQSCCLLLFRSSLIPFPCILC